MATNFSQADEEFSDILADTTIQRIVFDVRGNQLRQVITGTKTHETFSFPSKRWRRTLTGETAMELLVTKYAEAVPTMLDFNPQPCRVEGEIGGKKHVALPDFAMVEKDCAPILGEVKRDQAQFERASGLRQKALTMKAAELLGWEYRQISGEAFGTLDYRENLDEVVAHRFAHIPIRQEQAAVRALRERGQMTVADLAEEMGEMASRGQALICALMVRRLADIDLQVPLGARSLVRQAPSLPFAFPRIRL